MSSKEPSTARETSAVTLTQSTLSAKYACACNSRSASAAHAAGSASGTPGESEDITHGPASPAALARCDTIGGSLAGDSIS